MSEETKDYTEQDITEFGDSALDFVARAKARNKTIVAQKKRIEELEAELAKLKASTGNTEELEKLKAELKEANENVVKITEENKSLNAILDDNNNEHKACQDRIEELESELSNKDTEVASLKAKAESDKKEYEAELVATKDKLDNLQGSFTSAQQAYNELNTDYKAAKAEIESLKAQITENDKTAEKLSENMSLIKEAIKAFKFKRTMQNFDSLTAIFTDISNVNTIVSRLVLNVETQLAAIKEEQNDNN